MAKKRMFSNEVISTDVFYDLSLPAQALYFHLGMNADDDGFVSNPKTVIRMIGASNSELDELERAGFIIKFGTGVLVIRHWKIHNYIPKDRYKPTIYKQEYSMLEEKDGVYWQKDKSEENA